MRFRISAVLVAFLVATFGLAPGAQADPPPSPEAIANNFPASMETAHELGLFLGNASGSFKIPFRSERAQQIMKDLAAGLDVKPPPRSEEPGNPNEPSAEWTIGAGWYFYVYLNHGDIRWLLGLGAAGAAGAICFLLTSTLVGAAGCGAVAYGIWSVIERLVPPFPAGKCLEVRFSWVPPFALAGSKWVTRSC